MNDNKSNVKIPVVTNRVNNNHNIDVLDHNMFYYPEKNIVQGSVNLSYINSSYAYVHFRILTETDELLFEDIQKYNFRDGELKLDKLYFSIEKSSKNNIELQINEYKSFNN